MARHDRRELKQMHAMLQLLHNFGEAEQHEKCQTFNSMEPSEATCHSW
jgi:hypothetical protein